MKSMVNKYIRIVVCGFGLLLMAACNRKLGRLDMYSDLQEQKKQEEADNVLNDFLISAKDGDLVRVKWHISSDVFHLRKRFDGMAGDVLKVLRIFDQDALFYTAVHLAKAYGRRDVVNYLLSSKVIDYTNVIITCVCKPPIHCAGEICPLCCCIPYDCQAAYCYSVGKLAHYNPGISVWFYYNY